MASLSAQSSKENAGTTSLGALLRAKLDADRTIQPRTRQTEVFSFALPATGTAISARWLLRGRCLHTEATFLPLFVICLFSAMTRSDLVEELGCSASIFNATRRRAGGQSLARCHRRCLSARPARRDSWVWQLLHPPTAQSRTGRNPRTASSLLVPAKRLPHFKPGKALREAVAAPASHRLESQPSSERLAMKYLVWLLKAAIFFTLFAFALNNQHSATVHCFLWPVLDGHHGTDRAWRRFALGLLTGGIGHAAALVAAPHNRPVHAASAQPLPTDRILCRCRPARPLHGL